MNIQKSTLQRVVRAIINAEEQIEPIRQLLNEEISFNLLTTFLQVAQNAKQIDLYSLKQFTFPPQLELPLRMEIGDSAIEGMIKYYSGGALHLGINEWSSLLLSKEDKLLAKLASEREDVELQPPQYILSYCRKIILKECQLHANLLSLFHQSNWQMIQTAMQKESIQQRFEQFCKSTLSVEAGQQMESLKRYLKKGRRQPEKIKLEDLRYIFTRTNSKTISDFLQNKQRELLFKQNKKNVSNNPYVHRELRKLGREKGRHGIVNFREAKSIESHINRNKSPSPSRMIEKIEFYTASLEQQLRLFFRSLNKIMKLNTHILKYKYELLSSCECNFSILFDEIARNREIIPSDLHHYLLKMQINVPLSSLFVLVKRYCDPVTGKMNKRQFTQIFKLYCSPKMDKTARIDKKFRQGAALCLLYEIEYERKIEEQKRSLMEKVDLRQIFDAIDSDNDRLVSQTDLRIMDKKISNISCKQIFFQQFWWRMGAGSSEMVDYDRFMYEMIPRIKQKCEKK